MLFPPLNMRVHSCPAPTKPNLNRRRSERRQPPTFQSLPKPSKPTNKTKFIIKHITTVYARTLFRRTSNKTATKLKNNNTHTQTYTQKDAPTDAPINQGRAFVEPRRPASKTPKPPKRLLLRTSLLGSPKTQRQPAVTTDPPSAMATHKNTTTTLSSPPYANPP